MENQTKNKMETKKKNKGIWVVLSIFWVIIMVVNGGCIGGGKEPVDELTVIGSTTVLPLAQKTADAFMDKNTNASIQVSGGGSSVGIQAVDSGTADIGIASRDLKDNEKESYPNLVQHVVAKDGIAIIVHPSNPVSSLTEEQVKGIYNRTYTDWNELGGDDQQIVVVSRDTASGTREFFFEYVMKKGDFTKGALEKNSNGAVQLTVAQTPGAIGYVGLGYVDSTIKAVKINANGQLVEPTVQNILEGKYPIARSLNMFTNGEAAGLTKEYLDFIMSKEGQKIVKEEGFVPVN